MQTFLFIVGFPTLILGILLFGTLRQNGDKVRNHFIRYHKSALSKDVTTQISGNIIFGTMGSYKVVLDSRSGEVYSCEACKEGVK